LIIHVTSNPYNLLLSDDQTCGIYCPCLLQVSSTLHLSTEVPDVYDALTFYVPCEHPTCIRGVQIRGATYEFWSPNSDGIDYYPGAPLKEPVDLFDATSRYHDGRLGPQHLMLSVHGWDFVYVLPLVFVTGELATYGRVFLRG
jgi:hypothetical protein